jgi:preprotein translocase subunit YajC
MIGMVVLLGGFMYMSGRKRKAQAAELASKVVVGAKVMLTSGIYGEVVSINDDRVKLLCSPTTTLEVARGAVLRVVDNAKPIVTEAAPVAKKPAAKKPAAKK